MFGMLTPAEADPIDRQLSDQMLAYWTGFAATGDPNGAGRPAWPRAGGADKAYLEFSVTGPVVKSALRATLLRVVLGTHLSTDDTMTTHPALRATRVPATTPRITGTRCALLGALALLCLPFPAGAADDVVRTASGLVAGQAGRTPGVRVFKGIPYAAPPVGDLRWRAPQPVAPWAATRDASAFGTNCMQNIVPERKPWTGEFMARGEIGEDCLSLNVWTAAASATEKRPVFVWFHGGGLVEGSGGIPIYDGEALAKKGIVVVTINYRLGIFGFFAHPELTKEAAKGGASNFGFLDQIAALKWVQANIAAFGGDPARVTIGGQSAGAGSTHALTASPARARPVRSRDCRERLRRRPTGAPARRRRAGRCTSR